MFTSKFLQGLKTRFSRQNLEELRIVQTAYEEPLLTEQEWLAQQGFLQQETLALFKLRQWYQNGGSDRAILVRHLEFLKWLVKDRALKS